MKKGVIFDMDGTLWNTTDEVVISWQEVVDGLGLEKKITAEEIDRFMGQPMSVFFENMFPTASAELLKTLEKECEKHENEYIACHGGKLYPGIRKTLEALKNMGYHLYIVSNSQDGYVEALFASTDLAEFFDDYEMYGRTKKLKDENIRLVMKRNALDKAYYVGDTQGDMDASLKAGAKFIFASYGFGKAENAEYVINSLSELVDILSMN